MTKEIETLQDMLAKLDRLETVLSHKVDQVAASEKALVQWRKELTLEVEELKALKRTLEESLPEAIQTALKENIQLMLQQLLPLLVEGFQEHTDDFIKSSLKEGQKIEEGIDRAIAEANKVIAYRKTEITRRKLGLSFFFCLTSLLTAGGIFYYFPQHHHIIYDVRFVPATAELIVLGEAIKENINKLTPEQKVFFTQKAAEKLRLDKQFKNPQ